MRHLISGQYLHYYFGDFYVVAHLVVVVVEAHFDVVVAVVEHMQVDSMEP